MQGSRHERYVFPALLAVLFFGTLFVFVTNGSGDKASPASGGASVTAPTTSAGPARRMVTVKSGDNPTSIAERAGITLDRLYELNPRLDPGSLRPGQKLRLAR